MRSVLFSLVLLSASLTGQSGREDKVAAFNKLKPILMALKNAGASPPSLTNQLVEAMMALTDSDRQPSRSTVVGFADKFTVALIGRDLTSAQLDILQQSIGEVLSGSTTNFISASRFRETLTAVGIDGMKKQILTQRFMAIGQEVRGPDDTRLSKPPMSVH